MWRRLDLGRRVRGEPAAVWEEAAEEEDERECKGEEGGEEEEAGERGCEEEGALGSV